MLSSTGGSQEPPSSVPAGWYDDPVAPSTQRWWDGRNWTPHVRPVVTLSRRNRYGPLVVVAAIGGLGMLVVTAAIVAIVLATGRSGTTTATGPADSQSPSRVAPLPAIDPLVDPSPGDERRRTADDGGIAAPTTLVPDIGSDGADGRPLDGEGSTDDADQQSPSSPSSSSTTTLSLIHI